MICKWCGATIDVLQEKCPICGRDIPALSDCGGFYDIVPEAIRPAIPQRTQKASGQPLNSSIENKNAAHHPARKRRKKYGIVLSILSLALILALGLFVVAQSILLNRRIAALESQRDENTSSIGQLKRDNDSALAQIADLQEQLASEPTTQETTEAKPSLSETELYFCVMPSESDRAISDDLQGKLDYQFDDAEKKTASYLLEGMKLWEAELSEVTSEEEPNGGKRFYFWYELDSDRLGQYRSCKITWYYRDIGEEDWTELQEDEDISIDFVSPKSTITISEDWLDNIAEDGCEIKCTMQRNSVNGGSLKIDFGVVEIKPANETKSEYTEYAE